jgi:F0F1-type ATP synthase membrane subunit b/b'
MKALIAVLALLVVATLPACKEQTEKAQADISKGNPEGQQMRKKYEAANKEAQEQRSKADQ